MLRIIKNARIFAPADQGLCSIIIGGGKILSIIKPPQDIETAWLESQHNVDIVDIEGRWLVPGFVDGLIHSVGGGGEGGFHNRTLEIDAQEILQSGVTTTVSALGTDAITRNLPNLLGKTRELTAKGVDSYFYTGSYHLPPVTLTDSIETDLIYIPEIIGIGELALSDHRGSLVSFDDLYSIARRVRTSANLAGKKGIVFCHLGDLPQRLDLLKQVIEKTELNYSTFIPTHINRSCELFEEGIQFALQGGNIDITTSTNQGLLDDGEVFCSEALAQALKIGVEIERISFSSDANASLPRFDQHGNTIGIDSGKISSLFEAVKIAVKQHQIPFEMALQCITSTPANNLGLTTKGKILENHDADLVLIDPESLDIQQVWSQGVPRLQSQGLNTNH